MKWYEEVEEWLYYLVFRLREWWLWVVVVWSDDFNCLSPNDSLSLSLLQLFLLITCLTFTCAWSALQLYLTPPPPRSFHSCQISGGFLLVVALSVLQLWKIKKKHLKWIKGQMVLEATLLLPCIRPSKKHCGGMLLSQQMNIGYLFISARVHYSD